MGQERVSEPASHLPWSFPSVRKTKVFTCQLPYTLEHQVHTTAHARLDNLPWLFEATLWFRKHPFHFDEEQGCFWGGHSILSPGGEAWKQLKPLFASIPPKKLNFFFSGVKSSMALALVPCCLLWLLTQFLLPPSHTQSLCNKPCEALCAMLVMFFNELTRIRVLDEGSSLWFSLHHVVSGPCWNTSGWSPGTLSSVRQSNSTCNNNNDN